MSIYEACDKVGTRLATVTTPATPTVRVVPPGHGDDRHTPRPSEVWINIEPVSETHDDETNDSALITYVVRWSAWYAKASQTLAVSAQKIGTLGAACIAALEHSSLGGWARHGIALSDIDNVTYDTGGIDDLAYVVRGDVTIHRQE